MLNARKLTIISVTIVSRSESLMLGITQITIKIMLLIKMYESKSIPSYISILFTPKHILLCE